MKKGLLFTLAVLCVSAAQAVTIDWDAVDWDSRANLTLPEAVNSSRGTGWYGGTASEVLANKSGLGYGVHSGNNGGAGGSLSGTDTDSEGYWSGNSIALAGRNGAGGQSAVLVLGGTDIAVGDKICHLLLNATINADADINNREVEFGIGVWDTSEGTYVQTAVNTVIGNGTEATDVSLELDLGSFFTWGDGDKIIAVINGPKYTPVDNTFVVSNIGVSIVPEPTVLALLALGVAGLALKRKIA